MDINNSAPCDIKTAMCILGNKWTALIIRELADDAKRFGQLEKSISGLNPRTLSKRLDDLENERIIKSCSDGGAYNHRCYALTDKGRDLLPILRSMAAWGEKYPDVSMQNIA
ncbi:MAG: helix-turn-helix domain-containing protein [Candidatus Saccharimonadales bacterium]